MIAPKPSLVFLVLSAALAITPRPALAKSLGWNADALAEELKAVQRLKPAPADVTELKFSEFYVMPVGPGGLQLSEKLQGLAGQRVRVLGFMVRQTQPIPGEMVLTPYSTSTHEGEYGLCDDLPPATLFVQVPKYRDIAVPFSPGPLLLTGRLEVGRRDEEDGRVSFVRLLLDPESSAQAMTSADQPAKTEEAMPRPPAH